MTLAADPKLEPRNYGAPAQLSRNIRCHAQTIRTVRTRAYRKLLEHADAMMCLAAAKGCAEVNDEVLAPGGGGGHPAKATNSRKRELRYPWLAAGILRHLLSSAAPGVLGHSSRIRYGMPAIAGTCFLLGSRLVLCPWTSGAVTLQSYMFLSVQHLAATAPLRKAFLHLRRVSPNLRRPFRVPPLGSSCRALLSNASAGLHEYMHNARLTRGHALPRHGATPSHIFVPIPTGPEHATLVGCRLPGALKRQSIPAST